MIDGVCKGYTGSYEGRTWKWYESYLKRFKYNPKRMLDLGCGPGLFMECCREHGIECYGIDASDNGINICLEKGFNVFNHNLSKPFIFMAEDYFDAVFCFQVIEHLEPNAQLNILRESFRVLKKGGQLHVDSPCWYYYEAAIVPTHISLLTPKKLSKLAEDVGFSKIDLGFNYPQYPPDIPKEQVDAIWSKYHPDILAQTACIMAEK